MLRRILIVDDSLAVRTQLRQILANVSPGAEVIEAASLEAARAALRGHQPQIVFLDIMLGGGESGSQLAAELRRNASVWSVIIVTALSPDHPDVIAARVVPNIEVVRKPIRRWDIEKAMKRAGRGRAGRRPLSAPFGNCVTCGTPLARSWAGTTYCPGGCAPRYW